MPGLLKRRKRYPSVAVGRKAVENTTIITTGVVQHSPLLSLPYELFVIHIAPYIPGPEWPAGPIFWDNSHSDTSPTPPPEYYSRQNTLRALSQTCVRLRAIFLPLLWERFEAFRSGVQDNTMNSRNTRTTSPNSNMLSRRAAGLLRGGLAGYVRTAIISLTEYSPDTSNPISLFVQCLRSMSNLETLHITSLPTAKPSSSTHLQAGHHPPNDSVDNLSQLFTTALAPHTFPSITHLKIPPALCPLITRCPALRSLTCIWGQAHLKSWGVPPQEEPWACISELVAGEMGTGVEEVLEVDPNWTVFLQHIPIFAPRVQRITFARQFQEYSADDLQHLSPLQHLSEIELRAWGSTIRPRPRMLEENVAAARALLRASPAEGTKVLAVRYRQHYGKGEWPPGCEGDEVEYVGVE